MLFEILDMCDTTVLPTFDSCHKSSVQDWTRWEACRKIFDL